MSSQNSLASRDGKPGEDWSFQQRMQQKHALPLYRERFPDCDIVEVDTEGEHERVAQIFDWAGVDKMIRKLEGTTILLSQRFRRKSVGDDFSLTYSRPNASNPVEFERLQLSHQDEYSMMPSLYGFGIANNTKDGQVADEYAYEQGFSEFYLIKIRPLIEAIKNDRIDYFVPSRSSNGNGNFAAYIDPSELKQHDIVDCSWSFTTDNNKDDGDKRTFGFACERCGSWGRGDPNKIDAGSVVLYLCDTCAAGCDT